MDRLKFNKYLAELFKQSEHKAKRPFCLLCGQSVTSFCNSHIIPKFVIKNIAKDSMVAEAQQLVFSKSDYLSKNKGVNNAETIRIICNECDNTLFQDYENEEALKNKPTNRLMAEIALKDSLLMLYKRRIEVELSEILHIKNTLKGVETTRKIHSLDIRDYSFSIRRSKKIIDNNLKSGFRLLYWESLPYKSPIAAQSPVVVYEDFSGELINDHFNYSPDIRMQDLHICIFPLKDTTSVFLFYHKDDRNYANFERRFLKLTHEEKQKYIVYLLFKYTENFLISPEMIDTIKNNEMLAELANEGTDRSNLGIMTPFEFVTGIDKELVDWKDVPNLLSEEFRIK